jgi:membrane protease YdiL (CAAX protease family)
MSTLNLVIAGLFLGLGFILTGDLAISIGLHITWNIFQGNVFGFPVSGTTPIVSFIGINQKGPDLVTGGAFGPEAGLIGLAALLLGSFFILVWVYATRKKISLAQSLAIYTPQQKPAKLIPSQDTAVNR